MLSQFIPPSPFLRLSTSPFSMSAFLFLPCKENVVHVYNRILLSHKKGWNWVICSLVDEPRVCHIEWSKSEREKQRSYMNTYMWNLEKWNQILKELSGSFWCTFSDKSKDWDNAFTLQIIRDQGIWPTFLCEFCHGDTRCPWTLYLSHPPALEQLSGWFCPLGRTQTVFHSI